MITHQETFKQHGSAHISFFASQVLIRAKCAAVNPLDTFIRSGNNASLPGLPYTPGCDGSGVVEAVGGEVSKFKVRFLCEKIWSLHFKTNRCGLKLQVVMIWSWSWEA